MRSGFSKTPPTEPNSAPAPAATNGRNASRGIRQRPYPPPRHLQPVNRVADGQSTENARRRGGTESRHDGKHVGVQEQASACSLRGLVPRPSGTAVYGPVRTVVWDPWLALAVSHGDPILRSFLFALARKIGLWVQKHCKSYTSDEIHLRPLRAFVTFEFHIAHSMSHDSRPPTPRMRNSGSATM